MISGVGMGRIQRTASAVCLVLVAFLMEACGHSQRVNVIATVGRHNIGLEAFQGYVDSVMGEGWRTVDDRVASRLLDQYLDQEVLAAAARRKRRFAIPVEPGRRAAMIRSLVPELCGPAPTPSPEAIARAVEARLQGKQPDRAHVRQIIVATAGQAQQVRERLLAGESFADLSQRLSLAPNAAEGGELGVITRGTLPEEFDREIFRLHAGEVSRPVRGPSGYHLFQVLEVYPGAAPDHRAVEATVRQELTEDAVRTWLSACVDRLAAEVGVRVLTDRLWFRYHGRYSEADDAATDRLDDGAGSDGPGNRASGATPGGGSHHGPGQ